MVGAKLIPRMWRPLAFLCGAFLVGCNSGEAVSIAVPQDAGVAAIDAAQDADSSRGSILGNRCKNGQPLPFPTAEESSGEARFLDNLPLGRPPSRTTVALGDFYVPCEPNAQLLVVRLGALWAGTWQWHVSHTKSWFTPELRSRVKLLDIVLRNRDNLPALVEDVPEAESLMDSPEVVASDLDGRWESRIQVRQALPIYLVVDAREMRILFIQSDPDVSYLHDRLRRSIAELEGSAPPEISERQTFDGLFNREQWDMLLNMRRPASPPVDPSNKYSDSPQAAALGEKLFNEQEFSKNGAVSCRTCHDSQRGWADGLPRSQGLGSTRRNSPSIVWASYSNWQFWDGRADSMWMQALGPLENPLEFGGSRLRVARVVYEKYRDSYVGIFGQLPLMADTSRFPSDGKPGDLSFEQMTDEDQESITRVFVNVGKSIAAFERTLKTNVSKFDQYVQGDLSAIATEEKHGALQFFRAGCAQCHFGPRLTDDAFHNLRFPSTGDDGSADEGRLRGLELYESSKFRKDGPYSDFRGRGWNSPSSERRIASRGMFKTPTLRGVVDTAPYGHSGEVATLDEVVRLYERPGLPSSDPRALGAVEPWVVGFSDEHRDAILKFLSLMTEGGPLRPVNSWDAKRGAVVYP